MRNGMRMALAMAFMVGCLPPGALARSSDPPEPVLWEDPAIVNNSSGIDENSSSDVSTSEEYGPRFIEVLRDDSFIYLMDRKTAHYRKVPHLAKERMIDVWIKLEPLEFLEGDYTYPSKYYLEHYLIRPKTQQVMFLAELEVAGRPSNELKEMPYDPRRWERLVPGSIEDSVIHAVMLNEGQVKDEAANGGASVRDYVENIFNISL